MTAREIMRLEDLRGFRGAPPLTPDQRLRLQAELRQRVNACDWCTIGVMAPASGVAREALRRFEQALGWPPLADASAVVDPQGPVFLKGHQGNGTLWLREEAGLAEGVLISGHSASDPAAEDTWGPLPLDFFASDPGQGGEDGAAGL
ncbi:MAG: DUF1824 family protein [Cyanobacteriota bacterium]|nr:DUF1824 family protein [Cyanobacteriota bacterium]